MSIRSFLGLCEHRWEIIGQLEKKTHDIVAPANIRIIEIRCVQQCKTCGKIRSVVL